VAYKQKYGISHLPHPPKADWLPPEEQEAWRVREQIVKQEEAERAAVEAARAARKAAEAEANASAQAAADKIINSDAAPARRNYSVGAHYD
jgi:hypothetical protein